MFLLMLTSNSGVSAFTRDDAREEEEGHHEFFAFFCVPPRRVLLDAETGKTSMELYIMIPFVCGLVGYVTNVLALKMTFTPLEFFPRCLKFAQVPGQLAVWVVRRMARHHTVQSGEDGGNFSRFDDGEN